MGSFITLEGMGFPLPGEIVLLTAGALAAQGELGIVGVTIAACAGTIAGGTGGYWIGRTGGIAILRRYGRWVGITAERELAARAYFEKSGARTIIIARFVALLRMIAGIIAGSVEMPFGLFSMCNAVGGILWSVTFAALGYLFGSHLHELEHYLRQVSFGLLLILLLGIVVVWVYKRKRDGEQPPTPNADE